jgi:hypothetical protein
LDLHRSTVTEIVAPLLAAGVLREESPEQDNVVRAGRPPAGTGLGGALEVAAEHYLTTLVAQNGAA